MGQKQKPMDLMGQIFTRLTVIGPAEHQGKKKAPAWTCRCECGNIHIVKAEYLRSGSVKSCGCLNREKTGERAKLLFTSTSKDALIKASAKSVYRNNYSEMNFDDFYRISQQNCYYCNAKPFSKFNINKGPRNSEFAQENGWFYYNGLDRLDNSISNHTVENCVPCCKFCNIAKRDRTAKEFLLWIRKLAKKINETQEMQKVINEDLL
jgi:hypothetical protein